MSELDITPERLGFLLLSVVTIIGALGAVTLKNITRAVLALIVFFFGVAALFFMLRADFIGVIQILVYVGAVAVLISFAIVLTRSPEGVGGEDFRRIGGNWVVGALSAVVLGGLLVGLVLLSLARAGHAEVPPPTGTVADVGMSMMTAFVLPFELASLLLTAALVGAVVIAVDEVRAKGAAKAPGAPPPKQGSPS